MDPQLGQTEDAGSGRKGAVQQVPADPKAKATEKEGSVDKGKGKGKEKEKEKELQEDPKGIE